MGNKSCCCFGHREIHKDISDSLQQIIEDLIVNKNVKTFYTGGMGEFDSQFASAVRLKKKVYNDIELVLVYPYLTKQITQNRDWYQQRYDAVLIPSKLAGIHYKAAIKARNQWLVDNSDYVISFVWRTFGGAYDALCYAKKQGKEIYTTLV